MTANLDTQALRALEAVAAPGPWTRGEYDEAITSPSGGVFDRGTGLIAQQVADEEFVCALRNAAPALLDAAEERDRLKADRDKWHRSASEFRGALESCCNALKLPQQMDVPKHVRKLLNERDALKAEVERLREALSGLMERLRPEDFRGDPRFANCALDRARAALRSAKGEVQS